MHAALMANACKKSTIWNCSNLKIQRNQKEKKSFKDLRKHDHINLSYHHFIVWRFILELILNYFNCL